MSNIDIQSASNESRTAIAIRGMTCSGCTGRVQRALAAEAGVAEASVDLQTGTATVTYDPAATTREALVEVVRRTGYPAEIASAPAAEGGGHEHH